MLKLVIFLTTRIYDCSLARQLCLSRFSFSQLGSMTAHFSTIMLKLVLFLTTRTYDRSLARQLCLSRLFFSQLGPMTAHLVRQLCLSWFSFSQLGLLTTLVKAFVQIESWVTLSHICLVIIIIEKRYNLSYQIKQRLIFQLGQSK